MRSFYFSGVFLGLLNCAVMADPTLKEQMPRIPAKAPNEAVKTFKTLDGFQMDLLAAEPLVTDPVAMAYDENGVAYVAEMNDYPYTDKTNDVAWRDSVDPAGGVVRMLVDEDGDGKFDKSYIFAKDLSWPTGIACWKGGIFVAAAPDIWYLKDTKGTHQADVRIKVYTGFRKYNVQAVMNNLAWGLDNKIYGAGSGNGGMVRPGNNPEANPIILSKNDFRFDPVSEKFEAISGGARFGNTFDDWGNRFICNIRNPVEHVILPNEYLARNPYLAVKSAIFDCAKASDDLPVYRVSEPEPWRSVRAKRWANESDHKYPRSETVADGYFTSTSGLTVYRGAAYPKKYYGNVFLGEVAGNLVHRQVLTPSGVTFSAERGDQQTEFVRSTDNWFRPVNYINAPDGTLHVLDMYRETIEHPWSIPDDIKAELDLLSGKDRGRIYRLSPPNFKVPKPPRLGQATTKELVATLANPNSWWRETAQRLLFERQDQQAITPLRKMLAKSKSPLARLHALYCLDGLGALRDEDLAQGLKDPEPGVRQHCVRLADSRLKKSPQLTDKILALAGDADIRVRFQTAFTLGAVNHARRNDALLKIARQDAMDNWVLTAVLSSITDQSAEMLEKLASDKDFSTSPTGLQMAHQLAFITGARNKSNEVERVLAVLPKIAVPAQTEIVRGLADGLKRAGKSIAKIAGDPSSPAARMITGLLKEAQAAAADDRQSVGQRQQAILLLGYDEFSRVEKSLAQLLNPKQPQEIQAAAIHVLSGFISPQVAGILLNGWRGYTPAIRSEAVDALVARKERLSPLLEAIESKKIAPNQIPLARRNMLMAHKDSAISSRALALFGQNAPSPRKEVIANYQPALSLPRDKARGLKIYEANCATCHRVGDKGNDVGPNLATIRAWSPDQIMVNILDPNREVSPNYVNYMVDLKDGQNLTGLIAEETATTITLKGANNVQNTILRQNIEKITSLGMSLMPEGLEAAIPPQGMADLIAFLLSPNF